MEIVMDFVVLFQFHTVHLGRTTANLPELAIVTLIVQLESVVNVANNGAARKALIITILILIIVFAKLKRLVCMIQNVHKLTIVQNMIMITQDQGKGAGIQFMEVASQ